MVEKTKKIGYNDLIAKRKEEKSLNNEINDFEREN